MSGRVVRWLLSLGLPASSRTRGAARLTIVRHHRVYARGERRLYHLGVSDAVLEAQVVACVRSGLTPVTVAEGFAWLRSGAQGHRVAFTFDDGYADNAERAVPLLAKHGARATFYLTAGLMGSRRAPWWDELAWVLEQADRKSFGFTLPGGDIALDLSSSAGRHAALMALLPALRLAPAEQRARLEALRDAAGVSAPAPCELADWTLARRFTQSGMEVGAHTMSHPFLTLLAPADQAREIADSVQEIRTRLGAEVTGLAYPNGDHDARTIQAARAAGLMYAVTTQAGDSRAASDAFALPRRALTEGACLGPGGRFSARMMRAELGGAFDSLRGRRAELAS